MSIKDRINWRQPKYMLPAILYIPLLGASYFVFDLFNVEVADVPDKEMQTTEYLNPTLPDAKIGGDGIGSKYENMLSSFGKIGDYTAVEAIDRDDDDNKEEYESKYTNDDIALLDEQEQAKYQAQQAADAKAREQEALAELERALAQARLSGQQAAQLPEPQAEVKDTVPTTPAIQVKGTLGEDKKDVSVPTDDEPTHKMVKKIKTSSDYFNTISVTEQEPKLIKAIIDEDIKAVDGSRVRLRLLDEVEIGEATLARGTYLYATMSGFSSQRVKGTISSILVNDELLKVSLTLYDTDGLEGLYVPESQFRETTKDVASGAASGNMNLGTSSTGATLAQWGMLAAQNAYQKTSNAISKAIKKNKAKLKYGTFVYIVNSQNNNKKQ